MGVTQLTPEIPSTNMTGPMADDGGNDIMAQVQRAQREAMLVAEESMRQSRKGLMEVKAAIQRQQSSGRYL